jgi:tetratricopeptide (TPR) repeat protein
VLYTEALTYHDDVIDDAIYTNRGNIYFDKKQYDLAIADYNSSLKITPGDYLNFENRGASYIMLQKYDSAIADLNQSILLKSDNQTIYYKRGVAYFNIKTYDLAFNDLKIYLSYEPDNFEAQNTAGMCLQKMRNYEESIGYFSKAIQLSNRAAFYLNRSYSYNGLGKTDLARNDAITARQGGMPISPDYAKLLGL